MRVGYLALLLAMTACTDAEKPMIEASIGEQGAATLQAAVLSVGHRCASVSGARRSGSGFVLLCDRYSREYHITEAPGGWNIRLN